MPEPSSYPKRLIEVDLPIRRISAHSRREKSIRHGHISTLHIWWARRPLAACRAVVCASLWPDPADDLCPPAFRAAAREQMNRWAREHISLLSPESYARFNAAAKNAKHFEDDFELRKALLDFIADFANWDNSTVPEYLETSRALTQAAHEALGGAPGTRPLVVDPFAGGGSIPLEALRVGADAFASDLNPVAVLLNKVVLEYIPRFGSQLAEDVKEWGEWIGREAEKELADFYPNDSDGAAPAAYLWGRTIRCEGPRCGTNVPLLRSLWLERRPGRSPALQLRTCGSEIALAVAHPRGASEVGRGTIRGGAVTCPKCGYTTPVEAVRVQLSARDGGAADARLLCVVTVRPGERGQVFREPTKADLTALRKASTTLASQEAASMHDLTLLPEGEINHLRGFFNIVLYGIKRWRQLLTPRQALALATYARLVREAPIPDGPDRRGEAVRTILGLMVDRVAVRCTSNCIWDSTTGCIMQVFNQGQALPARWEFAEMNPCGDAGSGWATSLDYTLKVVQGLGSSALTPGQVARASALAHPLPDDSASAIVTDPPYYAAIPYADLSDFFFSWLKRSLGAVHRDLLSGDLTEKTDELVALSHRAAMYREKNSEWFEAGMMAACGEGRRIATPSGVGVFVFANKETKAWEAMLAGLIGAGWVVTASWPIDTESGNRLRAKDSAALASSIHLVCRPREARDGALLEDEVGTWKELLGALPKRVHEWMPRLAEEGVVGADAIFACLGPALEIFSRYSRVEKASGEVVTLKEYLEHVWAAVAKEALSMIFADPETSGLEPDARLTAMWLWTVAAPAAAGAPDDDEAESAEDDDEDGKPAAKLAGFVLEFDAARKIAQGLGAKLEEMSGVVEVKGEKARLLPVSERARFLFGGGHSAGTDTRAPRGRGRAKQANLFREVEEIVEEAERSELGAPGEAKTTLDRIHQAMLLFGAGRSEALRRFLVDDGAGRAPGFWKLAQALSALYPKASEEKRWVDGVLARKKSLGF